MLGGRKWFYFGSGSRWKFSALSSAEVSRPHLPWFACSYSAVSNVLIWVYIVHLPSTQNQEVG